MKLERLRDVVQFAYASGYHEHGVDLVGEVEAQLEALQYLNEKLALDTGKGCSVCGETPVVNVDEGGSYWLCGGCVEERLNEVSAFQAIRSARCKYEDDGNDKAFFDAVDAALAEHDLEPQPCPMCNRYGEHIHDM